MSNQLERWDDETIVQKANELAREFYFRMGYQVKEGYRFDRATHPQEVLCWDLAAAAFEKLRDTDIDNALAEIGEG